MTTHAGLLRAPLPAVPFRAPARPFGPEAAATEPTAAPTATPMRAGHAFGEVRVQPKLAVNAPGDVFEQEADRAADAVARGGPAAVTLRTGAPDVQREEAAAPTDGDKMKEGAKKVGEALLETPVGKKLTDAAKEKGEAFIGTLPGKIITGTAAAGAIAAIVATDSELPIQVPEIPLDVLAPGLKVKLTYEGPVRNPTSGSILFTYTPGATDKKPATGGYAAETARLAADHAKFREGMKSPAERAAERAAERRAVTGVPGGVDLDAIIKRTAPLGGGAPGAGVQFGPAVPGLDLKPATEAPKKKEPIQRKQAHGRAGAREATPAVEGVLAQVGQPLDAATRAGMEARFGHSFGHVRVHADGAAAASARSIDAHAYAAGAHVVFGAGRYAPGTADGQRLLAHELAHVVQQAPGTAPVPGLAPTPLRLGRPSERAEREADAAAGAALAGRPVPAVTTEAGGPVVRGSWLGGGVGAGIGALAGGLLGAFLGPLGGLAGALIGGAVGLVAGALVGDAASRRERALTEPEREIARPVFGRSVDLGRVRVTRDSLLSTGSTRTVGNAIHFEDAYFRGDTLALTDAGLVTLIHEMGHVWQYQNGGPSYIVGSLAAQIRAAVSVGDRNAAYDWEAALRAGTPWADWNPEQQAEAISAYNEALRALRANTHTTTDLQRLAALEPVMVHVRRGEGAPGGRRPRGAAAPSPSPAPAAPTP